MPPWPPPDSAADRDQPERRIPSEEEVESSLETVLHTAAPSDLLLPSAPPDVASEATLSLAAASPFRKGGVPGYDILGLLGSGGMGIVYKARQIKLNRLVALKMIRAGDRASQQMLARFRTEAEAVARLQHANVVQIHEVGEHQGLPYFSMELCPGGTLADQLDGTPWQPRNAARLLVVLVRAIQAAHEAGIVHRDLKPANILLAADGTPKVSDFGLAKKLEEQGQTQTGVVMGTPSYMAPEQAGCAVKTVGPATDVYALGALLYEMLTGRPPFRAATNWETIEQVRREEPVPVRRLQPRTPRDLETICQKCLEKDPASRYDSAAALAEELQRWLAGQPIQARPTSAVERAAKWARRRPALAALLIVSGAAALGLFILLAALWRNAEEGAAIAHELGTAKGRLRALKDDIERQQKLMEEKRAAVGQMEQTLRRQESQVAEARLSVRRARLVRDLHLAETAVEQDQIGRLRMLLERHVPAAEEEDLRGFGWHHLWRLCHDELRVFKGHSRHAVCRGTFTPDGKRLIILDNGPVIKCWDVASGKERALPMPVGGPFTATAVSSDGRMMAIGKQDGSVLLWDVDDGEVQGTVQITGGAPLTLALSRNLDKLAVGNAEGIVRIWDVPSFKERHVLHGPPGRIENPTFSAGGRLLATSHPDGTIKVWDLDTGRETASFRGQNGAWMLRLAFSADGKTWATTEGHPFDQNFPGRVTLWDAKTRKARAVLEVPNGGAWGVAFSPDEQLVAVGADNGVVRLWDPAEGQVWRTLLGHTQRVHLVAFTPDGNLLATGGNDHTIRVWDLAALPAAAIFPDLCSRVQNGRFSPDGQKLATVSRDGGVRLWDAPTGRPLRLLWKEQPGAYSPLALSPDGRFLAARTTQQDIRLWDLVEGRERAILRGHQALITSASFSADGKTLATTSHDHTIRFWDVASAKLRDSISTGLLVWSGVFTSDGHYLASVDTTIRLWDLETKKSRRLLPQHRGLYTMAVSPDGRLCAATDYDGWVVRLASLGTGEELAVLKGHTGHVTQTAFTPNGQSLISASEDGTIKFWDLTTFQERFTLHHSEGWLASNFALHPEGGVLAAWASDGKIHLWSAVAARREAYPKSRWHRQEAIDCLQHCQRSAALFHVRRLLALPLPREGLAGETARREQLSTLLEKAGLREEAEQIRQRGRAARSEPH